MNTDIRNQLLDEVIEKLRKRLVDNDDLMNFEDASDGGNFDDAFEGGVNRGFNDAILAAIEDIEVMKD